MKSVVTSSKIRTAINFYTKALKRFPEKCSKLFKLLKIILINENSYLHMYPNEMSFLKYWFLKIKWLFAKYVKITKKTPIHKN